LRRHDRAVPVAASTPVAAAPPAASIDPPPADGRGRSLVRPLPRADGAAARGGRRLPAPGRLAAAAVAGGDSGSVHSPDGARVAAAARTDGSRRARARGAASPAPGRLDAGAA